MIPQTKKIASNFVKLFLAIVLLIYVFRKMNVNISDVLTSINQPVCLLEALLCSIVVNTLVANNRWHTFLSMIGVKESFWRLVQINWVSSFLGLVLPSSQGYDILRIYNIEKRHPEARGKVGSTVFVERILGLICLAFIATGAWSIVNVNVSFWPIVILVTIVAFMVWIIMSNWWYQHIQQWLQSIKILHRVIDYLSKLYDGLHTFPFNKSLIWSILLILMLQLSNIFVVYLLFEACGCHVDFIYHLCYQPLISVVTMIPITFGGIGIREGGFVYFYTQLGVAGDIIIAVSLLYYVVITLIPAFLGGILYLIDTIKGIKSKL